MRMFRASKEATKKFLYLAGIAAGVTGIACYHIGESFGEKDGLGECKRQIEQAAKDKDAKKFQAIEDAAKKGLKSLFN